MRPRYARLQGATDEWFGEAVIPISDADLDRIERELFTHAKQITRQHTQLAAAKQHVRDAGDDWPEAVAEVLQTVGHEYTRSPAMCRAYNKTCEYAQVCRTQESFALDGFRLSRVNHEELL